MMEPLISFGGEEFVSCMTHVIVNSVAISHASKAISRTMILCIGRLVIIFFCQDH